MKKPLNQKQYYNVKILRNFIVYLRTRHAWNDEQVSKLMESCGVTPAFLESDDNWFDQPFADRFYERAVAATGDSDLAYKVGSYATTEATKGIAGRLVGAFLSPEKAFGHLEKITSHYNKGLLLRSIQAKPGRAILRGSLINGCEESAYQCQNRIGMLEALTANFDCYAIETKHPLCLHKGDPYCEYEITWRRPLVAQPWLVALVCALVTSAMSLAGGATGFQCVVLIVLAIIISYWITREVSSYRLGAAMREQNVALQESLTTLDRRHHESTLLQSVMSHTTEMMAIQQLCVVSADSIRHEMRYDRSLILLADWKSRLLEAKALSGYEGDAGKFIQKAKFNIRTDNNEGHLIRVVNTKEPMLVRDVATDIHRLSEKSQQLVKLLGTQSFAAVPMIFRDEVLGVIAVENVKGSRPLNDNDLILLKGLSNHLAVAISNARSFESEQKLRKLFECYVPTEMRLDPEIDQDKLFQMRKKVLSIMFIDLVGFTSLSETLNPELVSKVLNVFIEKIQQVVDRHKGRINKIMGDGMLIYFDPELSNAIEAGKSILLAIEEVNSEVSHLGIPALGLGVGIHKGECTLGNIGCPTRIDYTLIGDSVNVAARIQDYSRKFGKNVICFSESLLDSIDLNSTLSRGKISLKGRQEPVEIFQWVEEAVGIKKEAA